MLTSQLPVMQLLDLIYQHLLLLLRQIVGRPCRCLRILPVGKLFLTSYDHVDRKHRRREVLIDPAISEVSNITWHSFQDLLLQSLVDQSLLPHNLRLLGLELLFLCFIIIQMLVLGAIDWQVIIIWLNYGQLDSMLSFVKQF